MRGPAGPDVWETCRELIPAGNVEFIDRPGAEEGAVEPASGLRHEPLCAELSPDLRQRVRQIHPVHRPANR